MAEDQNFLYLDQLLGEKDFNLYYGPFDPALKRGRIGEPDQFLDDYFKNNYQAEFGESKFFELLDFVANDLPKQSICSNYYLNKNVTNLRYLFRLLSISYLFENLKEIKKTSYNLGFGDICSLEWEQTFQKCRATDIKMANFIKRIKGNHLKDFSNTELVKMKNEEKDLWLKNFQSKSKEYKDLDLAQSRILYFCKVNKLDCQKIDFETLKFAFQLSCSEDQFLLLNICSNADQLYGLSYVKEAPMLLEESNAFRKLDEEGYGRNCIKRFINIYKPKEVKNPLFSVIFSKAKDLMIKEKRTYKQGSLFIYGSLDEFETKGLEGLLFSANEEVINTIPKESKVIEEKPQVAPFKEIPTLQGLLDLVNELKKLSGIDSTKVRALKSQFTLAEIKRFMSDSQIEAINMEGFKKEAIFSEKLSEGLQQKIYLYEKKATLLKLRDEEKLGKSNAPLPLSFLKYLIDFNEEQPLNNLLETLGERFFVLNDLEDSAKIFYIELKRETNFWQISILKQIKGNDSKPKFK
jgi:hypothetical protein